ncbi:D-alanine--D-alanine ligase, partial [bacterium]
AVAGALERAGYDVSKVDASEILHKSGDLSGLIGDRRPDCAFLTVHGPGQEDGSLVGLMRLLHLPYTGSGLLASALAMDKDAAKAHLQAFGLPVPRGAKVTRANIDRLRSEGLLIVPSVVKPNANGSTVGVSFVEDESGLMEAIHRAFAYDDEVLVEEWLRGMEVSVPVLLEEVLPTIEIVPGEGTYDFANKYTPGATEEIIPARLSPEVYAETQRLAMAAHRALGCEAVSRTDMIVVNGDTPVILETNTLPGMTGTSLLPNAALAAGISFEEVCSRLVEDAIRRYEEAA